MTEATTLIQGRPTKLKFAVEMDKPEIPVTRAELTKWRKTFSDEVRRYPYLGRVKVSLKFSARRFGNRNQVELLPLVNQVCKALVLAGVVYEDTPEQIERVLPIIERPVSAFDGSWVFVTVEQLQPL